MFGKKKNKRVKEKKEKRSFFGKKKTNSVQSSSGFELTEIEIIKERMKKDLIKEVNNEFINGLKETVKNELRYEIRRELSREKSTNMNRIFTQRVKNEIKSQLKDELRTELFESIKKDIILDIKINNIREKEIKEKLSTRKEKLVNKNINNSNMKRPIETVNRSTLRDEDFIKEFLAPESEEIKVYSNIKTEPIEIKVNKSKGSKLEYTKTEIIEDQTRYDETIIECYEDDFFEDSQEQVSATQIEKDEFSVVKEIAENQRENFLKLSSDIKVIGKRSLDFTKDEFEKIKKMDTFKKCYEKINDSIKKF